MSSSSSHLCHLVWVNFAHISAWRYLEDNPWLVIFVLHCTFFVKCLFLFIPNKLFLLLPFLAVKEYHCFWLCNLIFIVSTLKQTFIGMPSKLFSWNLHELEFKFWMWFWSSLLLRNLCVLATIFWSSLSCCSCGNHKKALTFEPHLKCFLHFCLFLKGYFHVEFVVYCKPLFKSRLPLQVTC